MLNYKIIFFISLVIGSSPLFSDTKTIYTSISPIKFLIDQLIKGEVKTGSIFPEGSSPHTFSPSTKTIIEVSKSNIFVTINRPFEIKIIKKIKALNPTITIINGDQNIKAITTSGHIDHHIWTSPNNLKTITDNIFNKLVESKLLPEITLKKNYKQLINKINKLDLFCRNKISKVPNKNIAIFHPAIAHFTTSYGLNLLTIEDDGKFPSPKKMVKIVNKIKELKITKLLIRPSITSKMKSMLSSRFGLTPHYFNPMRYNVIDNIRELTIDIAK